MTRNLNIRKATPADAIEMAPLILSAMEEIVYYFIGTNTKEKGIQFLVDLINQSGNQYSYENGWILESDEEIIGAALIYDGALLELLREPVLEKLRTQFNRDLQLENETQAGEYYLDCIAVKSSEQGKGWGSKFLAYLIQEFVHQQKKSLGLLVDPDNPTAKKLYQKMGFQPVGYKKLAGKSLEHLQIKFDV